jgi:hypothetical protein
MTEWELYGFITQEENKFYLRNLLGEEGLAYDFSVNIGDTVEINNPFGAIPVAAIVNNVDSVLIEPGNELRKRISLYEYQYYFNEEYWIEGIGSSAGLTVSGMDMTLLTGGDDYTLLCYYEEEEMLFKSTLYTLCYYPLVDIPEINQGDGDVSLFPNPVNGISHLIIQNPENKKYTITMNSIFGQRLQKIEITSPKEIEINSADFPCGVYFYSVLENNELIYCDKFLIK